MRARDLRTAWASLRLRELGLGFEACPLCGWRLQVRLRRDEMAVRCARCGASAVTQSLVGVLASLGPALDTLDAYELSAAGPLVPFLRRRCRSLATSEYLPDVPPGEWRDGVQCQDVQRLTHRDASFDLCTSTEVFEHVADDAAGFAEIHRVLRPGGWPVFTVPIGGASTVERTALVGGERVPTLPPEYHADRLRGPRVFCYRNYGADIGSRLVRAGFVDVGLLRPPESLFGYARAVVVARKAAAPRAGATG